MTDKEIKDYVIKTIKVGDKSRITSVLKRYWAYKLKSERSEIVPVPVDLFDYATKLFTPDNQVVQKTL